jgi:Protein of unknown function (DUF2845)
MADRYPFRLAVMVLAVSASTPAFAFRCQSHLIKDGDPQVRVLQFCGEPASTQRHVIYRAGIPLPTFNRDMRLRGSSDYRNQSLFAERSVIEIVVEEWIYNLGPHRLMQRVRFEDGIVSDVDYLDYGYSED